MKFAKNKKTNPKIAKRDSTSIKKEDLTCQTDKDFASTMPDFNKKKGIDNESDEFKYFKTKLEFSNENRKSIYPKSPIAIRDQKIPTEIVT